MFERSSAVPAPANVLGAFALGMGMTFLVDALIRQLRSGPGPISDDIVLQRVRSRIGELVSQPDSVDVSVEDGVVRVSGQLPQQERDMLFTELLALPGVVRLRAANR
ncbi:MAG TPA: hypothetical protein VL593_08945 [Ramlibacter sp.]|nr:hypothetical protein [Ramlibacter sp.]